ncbi:MAG: ABC transporter ATP-binding protein [Actinomycetota bacterium]|nr:ABC transporter ATP-binding protein [Actinomycetota bacterium]
MSAAPPGLALSGLRKHFGSQLVLDGVDLTVASGAFAALLGASGSGKTTLLRLIAGFERPDAGSVAIGGRVVEAPGQRVAPEDRRVGFVPQEAALFPHLSVEANVAFGLPRRRRLEAAALLELVGMAPYGRRMPHQLSGGQQQRVALARALAIRPALVLLDEPFSSLDPNLRAAVREEVGRILREAGSTVLLVTHDQDEALSLADVVAVLRRGVVAQCATPRALYGAPADVELACFLGEANVLEGRARAGEVTTVLGAAPCGAPGVLGDGELVEVLVRPEQLRLVAVSDPSAPQESLAAVVERLDYHGHDALVRVRLETENAAPLVARTLGDPGVVAGERVRVWLDGAVRAWPRRAVTTSRAAVSVQD